MSGIPGVASVMSLFRQAPAPTPIPQPPQTANGQQQQAPAPGTDPTQVQGAAGDPSLPGMQVPATKEVSPLDSFADIWKTDPNATKDEFNPSAIFQMDSQKMAEALAQVDFAKSITAEDMAAVQAGGPEAMQAMMGMLNKASRETMGAAVKASASMIEQALTKASGAMNGQISSQVKLNQVTSQLQEANPALSHPGAAPLVEAMKQQFTNKYPQATSSEIAQMTQKYLTGFAQMAAGKQPEPVAKKGEEEQDFSSFFS